MKTQTLNNMQRGNQQGSAGKTSQSTQRTGEPPSLQYGKGENLQNTLEIRKEVKIKTQEITYKIGL